MQCVNNLMQLGIAVQNYESAHEILPPGVVDLTGPIQNVPRGYHVGWMLQLLPYLEQKNVARRFDDRRGVYADENRTVRGAMIQTFLCPSDGGPSRRNADSIALNNYAACHHDVEAPIDANNHGVFFPQQQPPSRGYRRRHREYHLSGEKPREEGDLGWASGTRASLRNTGTAINRTGIGAVGFLDLEDTPSEVDENRRRFGPPRRQSQPGGRFRQPTTPAAPNFAFGDGSVRFLKSTINARVYRDLGNRADGRDRQRRSILRPSLRRGTRPRVGRTGTQERCTTGV